MTTKKTKVSKKKAKTPKQAKPKGRPKKIRVVVLESEVPPLGEDGAVDVVDAPKPEDPTPEGEKLDFDGQASKVEIYSSYWGPWGTPDTSKETIIPTALPQEVMSEEQIQDFKDIVNSKHLQLRIELPWYKRWWVAIWKFLKSK
jgi:hypothetical protein